jgi:hypothetical protein
MLLQAQGSWLAPPCRSEKDLTLVWGQTANLSSFRGYRPRLHRYKLSHEYQSGSLAAQGGRRAKSPDLLPP